MASISPRNRPADKTHIGHTRKSILHDVNVSLGMRLIAIVLQPGFIAQNHAMEQRSSLGSE